MKNVTMLLAELLEVGIDIRAENGKLICNAPKGSLTADLAEQIRLNKPELIRLLKQVSDSKWNSLVTIQPQGSRPPFFCFHGAGGNVLNYSALVPYLGSDQPLYGLQSQGLDGITEPFQAIEPMAAHYIKEIRTVQSHGPYHFGGGSMGGLVALEAAQQLQKQGESIGILVMFDTLGPNQKITSGNRLIHRLRNSTIQKLFSYTADMFTERLENKKKMAKCLEFREHGISIPHELRYWYVERMNYLAMSKYEFSVFEGTITLIKGTDEEGGLWSDPLRGWKDMTTKGLEVYEIPGHHDTLVEEPRLGQVLAERLTQKINSE